MQTALSFIVSLVGGSGAASLIYLYLKTYISERIRNEIKHEYDQKLETLRAILQADRTIREAATNNFSATHRAAFDKRLDAISKLWQATLRIRHNTPPILMMIDRLTGDQYRGFIRENSSNNKILEQISFESIAKNLSSIHTEAENIRPFVGEYLFVLFEAYSTLIHIVAILLQTNLKNGSGQQWHEDNQLDDLLSEFMTPTELTDFHNQTLKLGWVRKFLERKMTEHMAHIISGKESSDLALTQAHSIQNALFIVHQKIPTTAQDALNTADVNRDSNPN